ncbi:helix-turn-helix transcriptional regulator [Paraburkholderia sp.]|uniref:helix-turn-helix transcriptional regulator n=1 Tax=Paraburkholderia sp. TaxID=1926495 RepID=UPI0023A4C839|nr:helix-turn-helix transcriptional regulator [Paraburkholderia sp.]MDE1179928.1 helix-turn-helix transcriptional regulator [Paraburkholderia sp.]
MPVNTLSMLNTATPSLGAFLRDRRSRLAPGPEVQGRRRTPGLRREEVASRANVSVAWYTWLEQGRGGPPSDEVLERLARALELDAASREMMFLLAQQRPPPRLAPVDLPPVAPAVQRVLDGMPTSPALVKTPTWDVVAWNAAATAVLADYASLPVRERNVLRRIFSDTHAQVAMPDWEDVARFAISVFRIDVARAGNLPEAAELVAELEESSAAFRRLWAENDVRNHAGGIKRLRHPVLGLITLEYSAYSVEDAEGLSVVVFTPTIAAEVRAIERLIAARAHAAQAEEASHGVPALAQPSEIASGAPSKAPA